MAIPEYVSVSLKRLQNAFPLFKPFRLLLASSFHQGMSMALRENHLLATWIGAHPKVKEYAGNMGALGLGSNAANTV